MCGVEPMAHSLEQTVRSLGMPTALKNGVVLLTKDYTVCKEGEPLTVEQARILVFFFFSFFFFFLLSFYFRLIRFFSFLFFNLEITL